MEITQTTASTATAATGGAQETVLNSDFDTFLNMLTTQMQNQDPLNPMDSGQLAVQLATFSSVEQQVLTNDLLQGLNTQITTAAMADYAGWVGMQARADAAVQFSGQEITVFPQAKATADTARLVVFDQTGAEVQWIDIDPSIGSYDWQGQLPTGSQLPEGAYSFAVDSYDGETYLGRTDAQAYGTVAEVRLTDGQTVVVMESGVEVPTDQITALQNPG